MGFGRGTLGEKKMQAIDVVMLTKNSEHLLERSLNSIYKNVPIKNLIIIDAFSTDHTVEILEKFNQIYGNVTIISMNGSRAKAREKGIAQVTTDWFMFADSDVILSRDWFKNAQKEIIDGVGAVWGVNIDAIPNLKNTHMLKLQILIANECFKLRGGTHDTLLRRDIVSDIKIPEYLHTYEDAYILNWIKQKGYKAVIGQDIYCLHLRSPANWSIENALDNAILELKCGLFYFHNFTYTIYYPFFAFSWLLQAIFHNTTKLAPTQSTP